MNRYKSALVGIGFVILVVFIGGISMIWDGDLIRGSGMFMIGCSAIYAEIYIWNKGRKK